MRMSVESGNGMLAAALMRSALTKGCLWHADGRSSQTSAHNLEAGSQVHPSKYLAGLPVEFCSTASRPGAAPLLPYQAFGHQGFPGLQASRAFSLPELSLDPFW